MTAREDKRRWWPPALLFLVALAFSTLPGFITGSALAFHPDNGMVCTNGPTFNLRATDGYISMPDGNSIYMWSFTVDKGASTVFQYPGPTLCVTQGDTVTVNLKNDLSEDVSIVFPGQVDVMADEGTGSELAQPQFNVGGTLTSLTNVALKAGGSVSYSFVAEEPGTYIYESGTDPSKQVHMGLIGALVVRPTMGASYAYNDASTEFDPSREFLLLFHEIDPDLHYAVEQGLTYDITLRHDRYWTINGRSMPDTIAPNRASWLPYQPYGSLVQVEPFNDTPADPNYNPLPALVRMANPGMANHPFHPHANHVRVIAQDGRQLKGSLGENLSQDRFTRTVGSGQTFDTLFKWTNVDGWNAIANPVPVEIPGLQNLVFKDDITWYSGSPYLGDVGPLPVPVTSFNQCGEQYFPWHSHALNEVQNFDEGFGGMLTLLRVDPPGGCP